MDFKQARRNMIEQQIRTCDVFDPKIFKLMDEIPRENFVPEQYRSIAYADACVPIGCGQVMLPPREHGKLLQALNIQPQEKILEIGSGTGYLTALLSKLGTSVTSVEIQRPLLKQAHNLLKNLKTSNITLEEGDAARGWDGQEQYDIIVITGSLAFLPMSFQEQLTIGGRLFVILGNQPVMSACLFTRNNYGEWQQVKLYETLVPLLINAPTIPEFKL